MEHEGQHPGGFRGGVDPTKSSWKSKGLTPRKSSRSWSLNKAYQPLLRGAGCESPVDDVPIRWRQRWRIAKQLEPMSWSSSTTSFLALEMQDDFCQKGNINIGHTLITCIDVFIYILYINIYIYSLNQNFKRRFMVWFWYVCIVSNMLCWLHFFTACRWVVIFCSGSFRAVTKAYYRPDCSWDGCCCCCFFESICSWCAVATVFVWFCLCCMFCVPSICLFS